MEEDVLAALIAGVAAVCLWLPWFVASRRVVPLAGRRNLGNLYAALPVFCVAAVLALVWAYAAPVRSNLAELSLFTLLGAVWLNLTARLIDAFASPMTREGLGRSRSATLLVGGGGMAGAAFCYSGSVIGSEGVLEALIRSLILTGALALLWYAFEKASRVLGVKRDSAAGLRLGALLAAAGLLLGAAAVGDHTSIIGTLRDFAGHAWPAAALLVAAIGAERMGAGQRLGVAASVTAAAFYLGVALACATLPRVLGG